MTTDAAFLELAERHGRAHSKAMHRILEKAMTADEARFLLQLPASYEDLALRFDMDVEGVESKILGLAQRGLVVASRQGFRYPGDLGTLHDNMLASAPQHLPSEVEKLWMDLYEGEGWWRSAAKALSSKGSPFLRIVPALESVPHDANLLAHESLVEIIQANKGLISVRRCCCRVGARKCNHPIEVCIQFGKRAEYDLYRASGNKLSADEAMAVAIAAEESGLVPIVTNMAAVEKLEFVCFCCGCCCMVINPALRAGKLAEILAPSRFRARIDATTCTGCGQCLLRCYFDVIQIETLPGFDMPKAVIHPDRCLGCGLCRLVCQPGAIKMEVARPSAFIPATVSAPSSIMH